MSNQEDLQRHAQSLLDAWLQGARGYELGLRCCTCDRAIINRPIAAPQVEAAGPRGIAVTLSMTCGAKCAARHARHVAHLEAEERATRDAERETRNAERRARRAAETAAELLEREKFRAIVREGEVAGVEAARAAGGAVPIVVAVPEDESATGAVTHVALVPLDLLDTDADAWREAI